MDWNKELRATGRAIGAWHRGADLTACLADLRRAARNIVTGGLEDERVIGLVEWR